MLLWKIVLTVKADYTELLGLLITSLMGVTALYKKSKLCFCERIKFEENATWTYTHNLIYLVYLFKKRNFISRAE